MKILKRGILDPYPLVGKCERCGTIGESHLNFDVCPVCWNMVTLCGKGSYTGQSFLKEVVNANLPPLS